MATPRGRLTQLGWRYLPATSTTCRGMCSWSAEQELEVPPLPARGGARRPDHRSVALGFGEQGSLRRDGSLPCIPALGLKRARSAACEASSEVDAAGR